VTRRLFRTSLLLIPAVPRPAWCPIGNAWGNWGLGSAQPCPFPLLAKNRGLGRNRRSIPTLPLLNKLYKPLARPSNPVRRAFFPVRDEPSACAFPPNARSNSTGRCGKTPDPHANWRDRRKNFLPRVFRDQPLTALIVISRRYQADGQIIRRSIKSSEFSSIRPGQTSARKPMSRDLGASICVTKSREQAKTPVPHAKQSKHAGLVRGTSRGAGAASGCATGGRVKQCALNLIREER